MDSFLPFSSVELENASRSHSQTILHLNVLLLWILGGKTEGKTSRGAFLRIVLLWKGFTWHIPWAFHLSSCSECRNNTWRWKNCLAKRKMEAMCKQEGSTEDHETWGGGAFPLVKGLHWVCNTDGFLRPDLVIFSLCLQLTNKPSVGNHQLVTNLSSTCH